MVDVQGSVRITDPEKDMIVVSGMEDELRGEPLPKTSLCKSLRGKLRVSAPGGAGAQVASTQRAAEA